MAVRGLEQIPQEPREVFLSCKDVVAYLDGHEIYSARVLESKWRSDNTILHLATDVGNLVFKYIAKENQKDEITKIRTLLESYDNFLPRAPIMEERAVLMEFVNGKNMFDLINKKENLSPQEVIGKFPDAMKHLSAIYAAYKGEVSIGDGIGQIYHTIHEYGWERGVHNKIGEDNKLTREQFVQLLKVVPQWSEVVHRYPSQEIHNDLNAANLMISDTGVRGIDPGFAQDSKDLAKDISRYAISSVFVAYEHARYTVDESRQVLENILENFTPPHETMGNMLPRIAFYFAQSCLSFSQFRTKGVMPKAFQYMSMEMFSNPEYRTMTDPKKFCQNVAGLMEETTRIYGMKP